MNAFRLAIATTLLLAACGKGSVPYNGSSKPSSTPGAPLGAPAGTPPGAATEGTINGGGGVGIRCGDRLEMLDLYEARQAGLKLVPVPASKEEAVSLVSARIARHFWNVETIPAPEHGALIASGIVAPIFDGRPFSNFKTGKDETVNLVDSLPLSNDYGAYKLPPDCKLEQIAFFSDATTNLSIVRAARERLDWLSNSMLVAHELIYLLDRREGLESLAPKPEKANSESARRFVGLLMSTNPPPVKSSEMPEKQKMMRCSVPSAPEAERTYFYAFDALRSGKLSLVFNLIHGRSGLYQLRADFKNLALRDLTDPVGPAAAEQATLESVGSEQPNRFGIRISRSSQGEPVAPRLEVHRRRWQGAGYRLKRRNPLRTALVFCQISFFR